MPGKSSVETGLGDRTEGTAEGAEPVEMDLNTGRDQVNSALRLLTHHIRNEKPPGSLSVGWFTDLID